MSFSSGSSSVLIFSARKPRCLRLKSRSRQDFLSVLEAHILLELHFNQYIRKLIQVDLLGTAMFSTLALKEFHATNQLNIQFVQSLITSKVINKRSSYIEDVHI